MLRDKGKNLRQCTKTVVRQVLQMLVVEGDQLFRLSLCGRQSTTSFDQDTKRWLSFALKSQEDLCVVVVVVAAVVVVVELLSFPSDRPASPSNCDFWQRVDPFDSGYYHCWEPKHTKRRENK